VFAPTDDAFAKLGGDTIKGLLADKAALTKILTYHVAGSVITAADIVKATKGKFTTLQGQDVSYEVVAGNVILNGNVKVVATDVKASNGIIHVIDTVLTPAAPPAPPTTIAPPTTVAPVVAPTTTVPGVTAVPTPVTTAPATVAPVVLKDVVDTAIGAGSFKTLVAAVQAAGLEQTLRTTQNITVFAPTDAAFAKLGDDTIKGLLADKAALTKILTYHVAGSVITAADIVKATKGKFTTLQGQDVSYEVVGGSVILNGNVKVVATDVRASNGIIHVIDTVLIPAAPPVVLKDVVDTAIGAGSFKTLVAAVQAAGLEQTLRTTQNITVFAPTDAAFAKLGDHTIKALLADKAALANILTYHVAGSVITAADIVKATKGSFTTLQGQKVTYEVVHGEVILNGNVKVIATDVKASNGIIHVIDTVLIPAKH
jgi:transforming growth factor-beta-induced protein